MRVSLKEICKKIFVVLLFAVVFFGISRKNTFACVMSRDVCFQIKSLSRTYKVDESRCMTLFSKAFDEMDKEVYEKCKGKVYDSVKREVVMGWFSSNKDLLYYLSDEALVRNIKFFAHGKYNAFREYWVQVISSYLKKNESTIYEDAKQMAEVALRQSKCTPFVRNDEQIYSQALDRICMTLDDDLMMQLYVENTLAYEIFESIDTSDLLMLCVSLFAPDAWYDFSKMPEKVSSAHEAAERFKDTIGKVTECVSKEPSLCTVPKGDALIIGDLHGNIYSANIFISKARTELEKGTVQSVVFLGDYIDRGFFSTEVLCSVFDLKLQYPDRVFLIRGNHEMKGVCPASFPMELKCRFSAKDAFDIERALFLDLFPRLPVAAEITMTDDKKILCVHGGIPEPSARNLIAISGLKEKNSYDIVPMINLCESMDDRSELFYNILWNDPERPDPDKVKARRGQTRFTKDQLDLFLSRFDYEYLVRGHENVSELLNDFDGKCYTVFSSHDYFDYNDAIMAIATARGLSDYLVIKGDGSLMTH